MEAQIILHQMRQRHRLFEPCKLLMSRESRVYLQVFGDGMCWSVGNQQNGVGLAHHPVSDLYLPGLPVIHSGSHRSHAQSSVVWVVQLPVPKTE